MSVVQKFALLKIRSISITFLSLLNLEAAPGEAMQLRRLIKSSNEPPPPHMGQYLKKPIWNRVNGLVLDLKEGLVEYVTVCIKCEVILVCI